MPSLAAEEIFLIALRTARYSAILPIDFARFTNWLPRFLIGAVALSAAPITNVFSPAEKALKSATDDSAALPDSSTASDVF